MSPELGWCLGRFPYSAVWPWRTVWVLGTQLAGLQMKMWAQGTGMVGWCPGCVSVRWVHVCVVPTAFPLSYIHSLFFTFYFETRSC